MPEQPFASAGLGRQEDARRRENARTAELRKNGGTDAGPKTTHGNKRQGGRDGTVTTRTAASSAAVSFRKPGNASTTFEFCAVSNA